MAPSLKLIFVSIYLLLALAGPTVTATPVYVFDDDESQLENSQDFLAAVAQDEKSGQLSPSAGLLLRFQYAFEAEALPPEYRVPGFSPLKCGTDLVRRYYNLRDRLTPEERAAIARYLESSPSRMTYLSSEGHFWISYHLSGPDRVPATDEDPANGIPDFVERAGQYLEQAYTVEILMSGFIDPLQAQPTCPVSFRAMQNYGYAYPIDETTGTTGIVLNNNFEGFPNNDDPEGSVLGALKVTAAHEFKHTSQFLGSRWSEGGWIELDAVWAEDYVFDQVNDYHNYLIGGSPIRHPEIPLDGGSSGTGSYEDCVWQIWMQETWGISPVVEFWERRAGGDNGSVMDTYADVLTGYGQSLTQAWGQFTAWNYLTGYRAIWQLGYEEAAQYPSGTLVATLNSYPAQVSGQVEHLAANFIRLSDLDEDETGNLQVDFTSSPGMGPLVVTLVIEKVDGTGHMENILLGAGGSGTHVSAVPLEEISEAGIVVGNTGPLSGAAPYLLEVTKHIQLPQAQLVIFTPEVQLNVVAGGTAQAVVLMGNQGQEESVLNYTASLWSQDPTPLIQAGSVAAEARGRNDKNIAGSSLIADHDSYLPDTQLTLNLTVTNGSTDEEWLTDLALVLPAGVSLLEAGSFEGGTLGDLQWNGQTGDGVTTSWHGTYGNAGYGVIRDGEQATAQIQLQVDAGFSGTLELAATITGDQFGGTPHSVSTAVVLEQHLPQLLVIGPVAGLHVPLGQTVPISWQHDGNLDEVAISLSRDGGQSWEDLAEVPADEGDYDWLSSGAVSVRCQARVSAEPGNSHSCSPGSFTIFPPPVGLTISPQQECIQDGSIDVTNLETVVISCDADLLPPDLSQVWLLVQHDGWQQAAVVPVTLNVATAAPAGQRPGITALRGNHPNPFNPRTNISFDLAKAGLVQLDVLDVRGRRVRQLVDGHLEAGSHVVTFLGRDEGGRDLPTGVYLVRLVSDAGVFSQKLLLAK